MNPRQRRRAIQEHLEQQRKAAEAIAKTKAETGYRNLGLELYRPSVWLCVRCGVMAQDREMHDAWHASMGQEWRPT